MSFNIQPQTISGKVRIRTPTQAQALSSRYIFLNINNAEPNLGTPTSPGVSPDPFGIRYALLSNNSNSSNTAPLTTWRAWSVDSPTIAAWSVEKSLALGDDARPIRNNCLVYNNYKSGLNRYNSEGFFDNTFNVFSLSGIYLFDPTTIGDPASATSFLVTGDGYVGVNTDNPTERLTVSGNISASNNIYVGNNLTIINNSFLGNAKTDTTTVRGVLKVGDNDSINGKGVLFGESGASYDVNLFRGGANVLRTEDLFNCTALSSNGGLTGANIALTNAYIASPASVTDSGQFLILNINGTSKAIRLWDYV